MKVLFIGGTGNISTACAHLAIEQGMELFLLNRGNRENPVPGAQSIIGDISKPEELKETLKGHEWDVVVNWIAFRPEQVELDVELFRAKTRQYIFISSASAYEKPPSKPVITESTPLINPFWQYSRDKIACEKYLMQVHDPDTFPVTIVRPSHTYDTVIPVAIGGWTEYTIVDRMKKGQKIIIHGDGTSLWTITHSRDFAKGFNGLLGHPDAIGEAFHITSDEHLTWNQIYQAVADAAGTKMNAVHIPTSFISSVIPGEKDGLWGDKAHSLIFDNTKIRSLVPDFKSTIPFHQGIKETIDWFEEKPERMIVRDETNAMMDKIIKAYER